MTQIYPIVMAGGTGTRLWPLSRESFPKQFQPLHSDQSMLQNTISRLNKLTDNIPLVLCNDEHRFIVAEQLRQMNKLQQNIILEPYVRNTAPAITIAALHAVRDGKDPVLFVLAADHVIENVDAFHAAAKKAKIYADDGKLVIFGIVPSKPETGYGYIKKSTKLGENTFIVDKFVEKPNIDKAEQYYKGKEYLWNSGMFMFKASKYLEEIKKFRPDIYEICEKAYSNSCTDISFLRIDEKLFYNCPSESVDYAVMEKTNDAVVVSLDANWNDIGSWSALWDISAKDDDDNSLVGDVIAIDSKNNYIMSESVLVATIGINNLIVVQTKDAVLVSAKDTAQSVKQVVEKLKSLGRNEYKTSREVYRPWGKYDSVVQGEQYKVKCITVTPDEKLSLQKHYHRAEHWVVVQGTAQVTLDGQERYIYENESVYIPKGAVHSLGNPGKVPLVLIEVQSGAYLGEDDIVRLDDKYGRG